MSYGTNSFAMVLTGERKLEPRDIPIPQIDDESALLRVEACGICGSDYEQFEGVLRTAVPVVPGHEPLGIIEAIGDRAAANWGVDVGDRVAVETMLSCRHCRNCLGGSYHLCDNRKIYSYIPLSEEPGLWGAYSQYMFLHANSIVHKVTKAIPPEIAVMFNPLGAGYRWAVEMPAARPGDTVVILGPGQRGLASVIALRSVGVKSIIVTGLAQDAAKLALARSYGASETIDVDNEDAVSRVRELTGGAGADIVVDVSSYATEPVVQAMRMVKPGGKVILAGVKGYKPVDDFVSDLVVMKEVSIQGAIGVTSSGYGKAIDLIESGSVDFRPMHTHDFDLEDAELAIRTLAREIEGDESIHSCLIPPH
jgi:threonine dehydrogenase-like Zn-dependent dehydrogenase